MKKLIFTLCTLFVWIMCLSAEEFTLRQADDLRLEPIHIRTVDNCEIIFWSTITTGDRNIYCQKLNSNGQTVWNEAIPVVSHEGDQNLLSVVLSSDNNIILLWEEYEIDTPLEYRVQKITTQGQRLWPETGVLINGTTLSYSHTALVPNGIGGAFVLYKNIYADYILGQNVDNFGNLLWPMEGLQLISQTPYYSLANAVSDGEGGMIININENQSSPVHNRLVRFSPQGTQTGAYPLVPAGVFPGDRYQIMRGVNGQFILYDLSQDSSPGIRLLKIDNQGNLFIPQAVSYLPSNMDYMAYPELEVSQDGGVVVGWTNTCWDYPSTIRLQRLNASFEPMWTAAGLDIAPSDVEYNRLSLAVSANGNIWMSWSNPYESSYCKAQLISPDGVPIWEAGGKTLTVSNCSVMSLAFAERGLFVWGTNYTAVKSVQIQAIGVNGAMLYPPEGFSLIQRLDGQAYLVENVALNDRFATVWMDYRYRNQIYYQISDQFMQPLLAENGVLLNPYPGVDEYVISAKGTPDGYLAVLYSSMYEEAENNVWHVYLQLIDRYGNRLYSGSGMLLPPEDYYNNRVYMGFTGSDIYLGWMAYSQGPVHQIMGQRIVNGQKMWGENGKVIASAPVIFNIQVRGVEGSYYLWEIDTAEHDRSFCKALKVDANGDPATGWLASGSIVIIDNDYYEQEYLNSGIVNDELISFVRLSRGGSYPVRAQKLGSDGLRMWKDGGLPLNSTAYHAGISDVVYGSEIAYVMLDYTNDVQQALFQKISLAGDLLLPEDGISFTQLLNNCYDANLVRFADGSYLCAYTDNDGAWIQNRDVYYRQISPNGAPMGEQPTVLCSERYQQDHVQGAVIGNTAMFTWNDDRAGIRDSETAFTGIWGNSVISSYVAIDDPLETPSVVPEISGNYPNPFNPSTTIAFALPAGGEVSLSVFNLKGQLVRTILNEAELEAGKHTAIWDGTDSTGRIVSSGVYFCALKTAGKTVSRKMLLTK